MAKVWGPLHSDDARGKLADSLVYMGWKGIKSVRQLVTPQNPQSADQGNIRTIIGGIGRAVGRVLAGQDFDTKLIATGVIPSDQSKQSYLVKYIKNNIIGGAGATMTDAYNSVLACFTGHTASADFDSGASTAGISDFSLTYDTIATFERGLGLYLLAKAAIAIGLTGSPYTKTLAKWTATHIDKLVSDLRG